MLFRKQRLSKGTRSSLGAGCEHLEDRSMLTGVGGLELVFLVAQEAATPEVRDDSAEFARGIGDDVDVPDSLIWDIDSAG